MKNYKVVAEEKARVIPGEVVYTDRSAELRLKVLAERTLQGIIRANNIVAPPAGQSYRCTWKWGMDGAGAQTSYNQGYTDGSMI